VIDLSQLMAIGLLMVRPGTLILGSPAFGGVYAPAQVKIALTLLLAVTLLPVAAVPHADNTVSLALIVGREMAIGLALGLAIHALVAAAEMAGHLAGFQMGLSYSAIVDPASGVRNNVVASLYGTMALIVFLLANGHHAFLRALAASYESLPIGAGHIAATLPQSVMALLGLVFSFGFRIAAPMIAVLVVTELGLGLIAKGAPALNIMAIGGPLRLLVGLVLLGFVAPAAVGVVAGSMQTILQLGVRFAGAFR
jgi:flagellar biosynthetic protein FliR